MHCLENKEIMIEVTSLGAELKSLKDKKSDQEFMWHGDPAYWGRTSPILFPLVGNYRNKTTVYQNEVYTMGQHGFARDMEFELLSETDDTIWFGLVSSGETKEQYPFSFRLEVGYRLTGRVVEVLWKVENIDTDRLHFSIGGHPAFNCPLHPKERREDYSINFYQQEQIISRRISPEGLATDIMDTYQLEDGLLSISEELFQYDALVIENSGIHKVSLMTPEKKTFLTVGFDAPLFGIWSPPGKDVPFICIEPWYGRCDHQDFSGELSEREWGNVLEPGKVFQASYGIEI